MKKLRQNRGKKLVVCAAVLASLAAGLISGCGNTSADEEGTTTAADETTVGTNTFAYEDEETEAPVSTTLYAAVTETDGSKLTLAVSDTDFSAISGVGGGTEMPGEGSDIPDGAAPSDGEDSDTADDTTANSLSTSSTGNTSSTESTDDADSDAGSADEGGSDASDGTPPEIPDGESGEVPDDVPSGGGDMNGAPGGDRENAPGGDGENAPDGDGGSAPDGEAPDDLGEMPSNDGGGMGENGNGSGGMSGLSVQTATLTVEDESVILVEAKSGDGDADDAEGNDDAENTENADADDADSTEEETANYESGSLEDIEVGSVLEIGFDENGEISYILVTAQTIDTSLLESLENGGSGDGDSTGPDGSGDGDTANNGGNMGGSSGSSSVSYEAVTEYTESTEADGETYESTGTDENAILVATADAIVTLKNITVSRNSSDSTGGDNSSFYGVGAAVLATAGTLYVDNAVIDSDAAGGAGVFSYGDAVVYVTDSTITTKQDTSGGIHVAGGGTLYAWNLTVNTSGGSAAAIRSDRGGGTMVVNGGSYTSNGTGSPAVYCTADIAVNNATLVANGSEAFCMEGLNTALLFDCDITGNMSDSSQNDTTWTFIVYQSMSGDSEVGVGKLQIIGGSITSENGGLFYTTNTESEILLSGVDITAADDAEFFLMCTGNANERGWGSTGSNGADCNFTAIDQEMEGDVIWDSISQLEFYMLDGSTLTGAFVDDESWAGSGGSGYANVYISSDSTWIVTGDSTVTYLYNAGTITDADGNTVSITGSDGTVYVSGTGSYTITVDSYETTTDTVTDFSGALTAESWDDYEVEEP